MMEREVFLLRTASQGSYEQRVWLKPDINDDQIEVKTVMTGVCRSDIEMMINKKYLLPPALHGHEGLGRVTEIGKNVANIKIGDYVATRGAPAYADYYNVEKNDFVWVPKADPTYIIEPVACAINIFNALKLNLYKLDNNEKVCILGTGFLASVVYSQFEINNFPLPDVIGNHNKDYWKRTFGIDLIPEPVEKYDIVIDLSSKNYIFTHDMLKPQTLIILGSNKSGPEIDFDKLLWNAVKMVCPSPRNDGFQNCMLEAVRQITEKEIDVKEFWTKGYDRQSNWRQAFEDSLNRPDGFNRAYIVWPDQI